jgi:hypothetical protein
MSEVSVLILAREMIQRGWVQGTGMQEEGGVIHRCAGQAIIDAYTQIAGQPINGCLCGSCPASGSEVYMNATREFQDTIQQDNIPHWNDTCGRTQADVIEAFDRTIARLTQPRITLVPPKIEATWKVPEIRGLTYTPVDKPEGMVKKVLDLIGV